MKKLAAMLERRGLSQKDFAKRAKVSCSTVCRLLQGHPVGMQTARRIIRASDGELGLEDFP